MPKCEICGEKFESNQKLIEHAKKKHPEDVESCGWNEK